METIMKAQLLPKLTIFALLFSGIVISSASAAPAVPIKKVAAACKKTAGCTMEKDAVGGTTVLVNGNVIGVCSGPPGATCIPAIKAPSGVLSSLLQGTLIQGTIGQGNNAQRGGETPSRGTRGGGSGPLL
jgi:hypothetical protein